MKREPVVDTRPRDWTNIIFLASTFLLGTVGTFLYTRYAGFEWWMPALFAGMYAWVGLGVCAGYHRHYAHPTHTCNKAAEVNYLISGACALQREVGQWATSHRIHHRFTDSDKDPYDISKGFWWAHIGWILRKNPDVPVSAWPKDLRENPLVVWQRKYYLPLAFGFGLGIPLVIGWLCGDIMAGLFWGGFSRIAAIHHSTFSVNSLAHMIGNRPFSLKESARDNPLVAFVALGEGFHNFHHAFMLDWRNGIRWYHFDPAKWYIGTLAFLKMGEVKHTTPAATIEARRLRVSREVAALKLAQSAETPLISQIERHFARAERFLAHASAGPKRRLKKAMVRRSRKEQRLALRLAAAA